MGGDEGRGGGEGGDEQREATVRALVHAALYDAGGESVEGGFVDRWVSNAQVARDDLAALFARGGFTEEDARLIGEATGEPGVPPEAAASLLADLGQWTKPLVGAMLAHPTPGTRAIAVRAAARVLTPEQWLPCLEDQAPAVRLAAVRAVADNWRRVPGAAANLRTALADPDAGVRKAAGAAASFYNDPDGSTAIARLLDGERDRTVRNAVLTAVARRTRAEGVHVSPAVLAERIGEPIRRILLREIDHADPRVREEVALALDRLRGPDVANALLDRLDVETDVQVRARLLLYTGYGTVAARAFPVLTSLLASSPQSSERAYAAFLLAGFGPDAAPMLIDALGDPAEGVRRAAAMSLGSVGDARALPGLTRELPKPGNARNRREFETAIRDVTARGRSMPKQSGVPSPELSARIRARIDALVPGDSGVVRDCKEALNALPLHSTLVYTWALRPDGTVLCMDHEAFARPSEPETDPRWRFAALVHGARDDPELRELVPPTPVNVQPCFDCDTTGADAATGYCYRCDGAGWRVTAAA